MILRTWSQCCGWVHGSLWPSPSGRRPRILRARRFPALRGRDVAGVVTPRAHGSDLWLRVGGQRQSYTAWGDGGGAHGDNKTCRTTFGVHGVAGSRPNSGLRMSGAVSRMAPAATREPSTTRSVLRHSARPIVARRPGRARGRREYLVHVYLGPDRDSCHSRMMYSNDGAHSWTEAPGPSRTSRG
jgi:hypothetical protein